MRGTIAVVSAVALLGLTGFGIQALSQQPAPAVSQPAGCCPMCMNMRTPFFLDSPGALQARANQLGLSEEQIKKLDEIGKESRQKAVAVLTPEQRAKLGEVSDKPFVMMQTCQQMMQMMMGGPMKGQMMCPMCSMKMGGAPAGKAETQEGQKK
jgi:hypothetical protein